MSDVRDREGDLDATAAEPVGVDVSLSAVPGADVSGAGPDGPNAEAAADGESGAPAGDGEPGAIDRLRFWNDHLAWAEAVTPESLGAYLTELVADKRQWDDGEHACLIACGVIATIAALTRTAPDGVIGMAEQQQALAMVQSRTWLGWPIPRAR